MRNRDRYSNYAHLSRHEKKGIDYRIRCISSSDIAIIAPHGGGIEPGTTEIAEAVADKRYSFYTFEGLKSTGNRVLHITSTNFDEPFAVGLIREASKVIAIHGCKGYKEEIVYLGGLDDKLKQKLKRCLKTAKFKTEEHSNSNLQGINPRNICNLGQTGKGVQLEITRKLRYSLQEQGQFNRFVTALRNALSE